jgi:hypothetical protein
MSIEAAARQAREALQAVTFTDRTAMDERGVARVPYATLRKCADAIAALDAALSQQAAPAEPVAPPPEDACPALLTAVRAAWSGDTKKAGAYVELAAHRLEESGQANRAKWMLRALDEMRGLREPTFVHVAAQPAPEAQP